MRLLYTWVNFPAKAGREIVYLHADQVQDEAMLHHDTIDHSLHHNSHIYLKKNIDLTWPKEIWFWALRTKLNLKAYDCRWSGEHDRMRMCYVTCADRSPLNGSHWVTFGGCHKHKHTADNKTTLLMWYLALLLSAVDFVTIARCNVSPDTPGMRISLKSNVHLRIMWRSGDKSW